MQRPVHPSFGRVKTVTDRWTGKKIKELKRSSKSYVNYALEVSVNGVMCVCSPFQVIKHILQFVNWLNS